MTPAQCARRCDALIERLCRVEERDLYRAYAAREIQQVIAEDTAAKALLADIERVLRGAQE